jgi:NitT/TauT family transport system ATP-binding protein
MASITLRNLNIEYLSNKRKPVLRIPELAIAKGEIIGIFGPNHVGKTTLLKVLAQTASGIGFDKGAEILYDGKPYDKRNRVPNISYVPQQYAATLFPWYSLEVNLRLPLVAQRASDVDIEERVTSLCQQFNFTSEQELFSEFGFLTEDPKVGHRRSKRPSELSGGQQQTLVLLRSLVRVPTVLIMDEPFSALDIYKGAKLREQIQSFVENHGITTVFVSHDLEETVTFADTIVFLQLRQDGNGSQIAGKEKVGSVKPGPNLDPEQMSEFVEGLRRKYDLGKRKLES